jgi:hypothetical protein
VHHSSALGFGTSSVRASFCTLPLRSAVSAPLYSTAIAARISQPEILRLADESDGRDGRCTNTTSDCTLLVANELFPAEPDRTAFSQTEECKQIFALLDSLSGPPVKDFAKLVATANGAISVRLPRSVHAALLADAKAEGVSLNQLCLSKLVAQLRAVL